MSRFAGKVALVTGAGTGIGRAVALAIAAEGGRVALVGRREAPLAKVAGEHPERMRYASIDIASPEGPEASVALAMTAFGRLDVLVNNAGVLRAGPLAEMADAEIEMMLDVNLKALLRVTRAAIPQLVASGGNVLSISSVIAQNAMSGTSVYAGSKAAVERITRALAVELGPHGVRVNAVAPGMTMTEMTAGYLGRPIYDQRIAATPLGRAGQPEDIARSVLFLASDDASWITGQTLQSSGGLFL